jgi:hypothetical protein
MPSAGAAAVERWLLELLARKLVELASLRTCVRVSERLGVPTTSSRAGASGALRGALAAAAELPQVRLEDALELLILIARDRDRRFDRPATRWIGRLLVENNLDLRDARYASSWSSACRVAATPCDGSRTSVENGASRRSATTRTACAPFVARQLPSSSAGAGKAMTQPHGATRALEP